MDDAGMQDPLPSTACSLHRLDEISPHAQRWDVAGGWHGTGVPNAFFDVTIRPDGVQTFVVGDQSSRGVRGPLTLLSVRSILQVLMRSGGDAGDAILAVNGFLVRNDDLDHGFVSLALVLGDPRTGWLRYAGLGMRAGVILAADGSLRTLGRTGPVLGVLDEFPARFSEPLELAQGDVLFVWTDGLREDFRIGAKSEDEGEGRLLDSLRQHASSGASANEVLQGVFAASEEYQPAGGPMGCAAMAMKALPLDREGRTPGEAAKAEGRVEIVLSIGSSTDLWPAYVVERIAELADISEDRIGPVSVRDRVTFVAVCASDADGVLATVNGASILAREVTARLVGEH